MASGQLPTQPRLRHRLPRQRPRRGPRRSPRDDRHSGGMRSDPAPRRAVRSSPARCRRFHADAPDTRHGPRFLRSRRSVSLGFGRDDVCRTATCRVVRPRGPMNRTALVTGAGGGIGSATIERLVKDGVYVVATDVKDEAPELPSGAHYQPFDLLADDNSVLFDAFDGAGLDYLVNTAGVALFDRDGSMLDIDESIWEFTLGVNLHGLRRVIATAVPHLRKGRGKSIVNVASIAGLRNMDSPLDAYQVSKAAVVSLS